MIIFGLKKKTFRCVSYENTLFKYEYNEIYFSGGLRLKSQNPTVVSRTVKPNHLVT